MAEKFLLTYNQPYEFDDDDSGGMQGHDIGWDTKEEKFTAGSNEDAIGLAEGFLKEGSIELDDKTYARRGIELSCTSIVVIKRWG